MAWGWRATFQYHLSLFKAQILCSRTLMLAKTVLVLAKRNDLECQLSLPHKFYLNIFSRAVKHFRIYSSSNTVFLFIIVIVLVKPQILLCLNSPVSILASCPFFNFVLWGKSAIWNENDTQPVSVCTPFVLFHSPHLVCITAAICPLLTMSIFHSAALLCGRLETAWKLFKLFLFHFSLCPVLSSSLFSYDIMRCYCDSSASLFSTLLHTLQIILSLSVVCVCSICC